MGAIQEDKASKDALNYLIGLQGQWCTIVRLKRLFPGCNIDQYKGGEKEEALVVLASDGLSVRADMSKFPMGPLR